MTRKTLIEDMERMENAAIKLADIRDTTICNVPVISILYWLCVAVLHLIEWEVKHYDA
jgi:hypothetical protein